MTLRPGPQRIELPFPIFSRFEQRTHFNEFVLASKKFHGQNVLRLKPTPTELSEFLTEQKFPRLCPRSPGLHSQGVALKSKYPSHNSLFHGVSQGIAQRSSVMRVCTQYPKLRS